MKKYFVIVTALVLGAVGVVLEMTTGGMMNAGPSAFGYFAAGDFACGIFAAGKFSVGIFSIGIFSIGIFSLGIFNIAFYAVGLFLIGWKKTYPKGGILDKKAAGI
jgi:quaternary ammonium compound-resistance protein SugE